MDSITRQAALALLLAACTGAAHAQVSLTAARTPVVVDFDSLPASGTATWTNNATVPGVYHARTGTGTTVVANNGSSNGGALYSYGTGAGSDRALGSIGSGGAAAGDFYWGVRLRNDTGAVITSLEVSYVGEQWRNSAAAAQSLTFSYLVGSPVVTGSLAEFRTTGTPVAALDFVSPVTGGTAGARDGNAAANRTAITAVITGLSIPAGGEVMLRWADPDHSGADHGLAIDDLVISANGSGRLLPALSVSDTRVTEGNTGTRVARFTVSLSAPTEGPVAFEYATADGSAQAADDDYRPVALTRREVDAAEFPLTIDVEVVGDDRVEPEETFHLDVHALDGATAGVTRGTGTIVNDDFPIVPISQIQGAGATSPLTGSVVGTRGIVTARKSNGFFIQSRDVDADADPSTSEGLFVFTASAPADFVQPGRWVLVQGLVVEFRPSGDPGAAPITELTRWETGRDANNRPIYQNVIVAEKDDTTYPLPAPVVLSPTFPDPAGPLDQLERVEGMRVTVPEFVVTAPTEGFTDERNARFGGSTGIFHGTIAGVARPFREPGIQVPDAPPAGTVPPIPQWDFNPELISVDSDALGGPQLQVSTGARIAHLTGPLDYSFRRYMILPDASTGAVTAGMAPRAAKAAPEDAFTVAGYNLERFFDDVNDGSADATTLTPAAYERRLAKASVGIRESLRTPDIVGLVEIESQKVVDDLARRLNADAVAAGQPDPRYVGHLFEGNDLGGIDVAVLVKTADTGAGTPRVEVRQVVQIGKDVTWTEPGGGTALLNDRPPLLLDAVVHYADGRAFPLEVVVVHQRSLRGAEAADASGERIRAKRQRQAEFLAGFLDGRQKSSPDTRLVVLGDFNAFEFNDGLAHTMGTVTGDPAPNEQTAVPGDGDDLVEPNLVNLGLLEPQEERYSFIFGGNAQTLDHVLVNEDLVVATRHISLDHARINADFPETHRDDANSPSRLADHDPVVAYFVPRRRADLALDVEAAAESHTGADVVFDVVLANTGPEQADRPAIGFDLDGELPGLAIAAPAGWGCDAPRVETGRTVLTCSTGALANGATARFVLSAPATADLLGRTFRLTAAIEAESIDPDAADNADVADTTVVSIVDLAAGLAGPGTHLRRGAIGTYRAEVRNVGPDLAVAPVLTLWGDAPAANVAIDTPAGWTCAVAGVAAGFRGTCQADALAAGTAQAIDVRITGPQRRGEPHFTVHARVGTRSVDAASGNDTASHHVVLTGPAR